MLRHAYHKYVSILNKHPLRTKVATAGVIFFNSDVATQRLEHEFGETEAESEVESHIQRSEWYDPKRTLRMTTFGVISTIYVHFWYGILEKSVERIVSMQRNRAIHTFAKVAIDQTTSSIFYNAMFFYMTSRLEGESSEQAFQRVEDRLWPQMQV
jgi:hypothetical protein